MSESIDKAAARGWEVYPVDQEKSRVGVRSNNFPISWELSIQHKIAELNWPTTILRHEVPAYLVALGIAMHANSYGCGYNPGTSSWRHRMSEENTILPLLTPIDHASLATSAIHPNFNAAAFRNDKGTYMWWNQCYGDRSTDFFTVTSHGEDIARNPDLAACVAYTMLNRNVTIETVAVEVAGMFDYAQELADAERVVQTLAGHFNKP